MLNIKSLTVVTVLLSNIHIALGQGAIWSQCGGTGWTGATTCVSGSYCAYNNAWYSQCLPGTATAATSVASTATSSSTSTAATSTGTAGSRSGGCGKSPTLTSGTQSITVNGQNRQYIIRVPNGYDKTKPYKLIFAFHWLGGTMTDVASGGTSGEVWAYYGQQQMANEAAILVAPQGFSNGWANSNGEDITFVDQMRQAIENDLCVDQGQRFSVGFSYGASMSYSIACSFAKDFRAVAVLSGGVLSGCSGGTDPIAYLGIHGVSDTTLPIALGRAMRDKFVGNNGCTSITPQEPAAGSQKHIKTQYSGCKAGYPVTWIAFDGGHGPAPVDGGSDDGAKSYTPYEIWTFFSQW